MSHACVTVFSKFEEPKNASYGHRKNWNIHKFYRHFCLDRKCELTIVEGTRRFGDEEWNNITIPKFVPYPHLTSAATLRASLHVFRENSSRAHLGLVPH